MRQTDKLLMLMQHCNFAVSNENDYAISSVIIKRIVTNADLSIEQIAEEACISQASVSRFVRKAGFDSWQSFRECCSGACNEIGQRRYAYSFADWKNKNLSEMSDNLLDRITSNLKATNKGLDSDGIESILSKMISASEVIFIGDEHALSIFYTLQLDLLFAGIPSYLYKNMDVQESLSHHILKGAVVIFLNIENNFLVPKQLNTIKAMKEAGAYIIVFSQQDCSDKISYDMVYRYGIPESANDGYYSLFYLSQLLSDLLIQRAFSKNESDFHKR